MRVDLIVQVADEPRAVRFERYLKSGQAVRSASHATAIQK
jgi:hypothetical protein